eukprot:tig00022075_g23662.t1
MENVKRTTLPAGAAPFEAFEEEFKKALKDPASKGNTGTAIERTLLKLGYSDVSLEKLEPAEILRQDVSAYTKQVILARAAGADGAEGDPRNVFSTIRNPDPAQPFVFYQATRKVQPTPECRIDDFEKICIDTMNVAAAPLLPIAREGEQARVLDGEAAKKYGGAELIVAGRITARPRPAGSSSSVPQGRATAHDAALVLATDEAGDAMQVVIGSDPDFVLNTLRDQKRLASVEAFLYLKAEELSASERRDAVFIKVWPVVQQILQATGQTERLAAGRERAARLGITK